MQIKENNHCQLHLPSAIRSFRLRKNKTDKGVRMNVNKELTFYAGQTYRLDRFEK